MVIRVVGMRGLALATTFFSGSTLLKEYAEVPVEVEKKLTKWQAMKIEMGAFGIIIAFVLLVAGLLIYRK